jgi:hypothetical protein
MSLLRLYSGMARAVTGGIIFLSSAQSFAANTIPETSLQLPPVTQLLQQGYEVKAGFFDPTGIAYIVMQKATSAYVCHSGTVPACDKLN